MKKGESWHHCLRKRTNDLEDGTIWKRDTVELLLELFLLFRCWPFAPNEEMGDVREGLLPYDILD